MKFLLSFCPHNFNFALLLRISWSLGFSSKGVPPIALCSSVPMPIAIALYSATPIYPVHSSCYQQRCDPSGQCSTGHLAGTMGQCCGVQQCEPGVGDLPILTTFQLERDLACSVPCCGQRRSVWWLSSTHYCDPCHDCQEVCSPGHWGHHQAQECRHSLWQHWHHSIRESDEI